MCSKRKIKHVRHQGFLNIKCPEQSSDSMCNDNNEKHYFDGTMDDRNITTLQQEASMQLNQLGETTLEFDGTERDTHTKAPLTLTLKTTISPVRMGSLVMVKNNISPCHIALKLITESIFIEIAGSRHVTYSLKARFHAS